MYMRTVMSSVDIEEKPGHTHTTSYFDHEITDLSLEPFSKKRPTTDDTDARVDTTADHQHKLPRGPDPSEHDKALPPPLTAAQVC